LPPLDSTARARLPDSAFAYIDSKGRRRLPINDASHVRNALARFDQTAFEDEAARERARERLLKAAKRYGIVPLGFFGGQLRRERLHGETRARGTDSADLPRGTVTFLLTDMEGSTGLLRQLGDAYATVLRDVRALIRSSVRAAGGHEVDARADEFFAVFSEPGPAVRAALAIQRSLRDRDWPDGQKVSVRIGIHTGRTTLTEGGYVGIAVNTAARISAAAHGGQILLSSAAREAWQGGDGAAVRNVRGRPAAPSAEVSLRTLGRYSLAGLAEPEELFQVQTPDLPAKWTRARAGKVSRPKALGA
jgi:class 3 adenylate cyclase